MSCKICRDSRTIKAHLIPRAFARQVQTGTSHALVSQSGSFRRTQSGRWDRDILCADCDGALGAHENYGFGILNAIRNQRFMRPFENMIIEPVDTCRFLRFIASIILKYTLTKKQFGRIAINQPLEPLICFLFENGSCPLRFNAVVFRPIRYPGDHGLFGYQAPKPDNQLGVDLFRIMLGGCIIFAIDSENSFGNNFLDRLRIRDKAGLPFGVCPATLWEEYTDAQAVSIENSKLSEYLSSMENG